VESLVNKGAEFVQLVGHAAPAPILRHILGEEMLLSIHNAIISKPPVSSIKCSCCCSSSVCGSSGGSCSTSTSPPTPMPLHTDQWWMPQPQRRSAPPRVRVGSINRATSHTAAWGAESEFIAPPVAAQVSAIFVFAVALLRVAAVEVCRVCQWASTIWPGLMVKGGF
jgi:hypothetical protein